MEPRLVLTDLATAISISGEDGNEAAAVIVGAEDGTDLIRDIEWGRP
ncbi:MAG: hypothetical protein AAFQ89_13175 [Cyanobacteria bacterium J06626_18]